MQEAVGCAAHHAAAACEVEFEGVCGCARQDVVLVEVERLWHRVRAAATRAAPVDEPREATSARIQHPGAVIQLGQAAGTLSGGILVVVGHFPVILGTIGNRIRSDEALF